MTEAVSLAAAIREEVGTGPARLLRKKGLVPAIVYGKKKAPLAISIEEKDITKLYRKGHFISTVFELQIGNVSHKVLPKAIELHPITDIVRHVDFIHLNDTVQKSRNTVVYEGKDRALGVKRGGFFNIVKRRVKLLCPVDSIPRSLCIDVANMQVGHSLKAGSLTLPQGAKLLEKEDTVIASVTGRGGKSQEEETTNTEAKNKEK